MYTEGTKLDIGMCHYLVLVPIFVKVTEGTQKDRLPVWTLTGTLTCGFEVSIFTPTRHLTGGLKFDGNEREYFLDLGFHRGTLTWNGLGPLSKYPGRQESPVVVFTPFTTSERKLL